MMLPPVDPDKDPFGYALHLAGGWTELMSFWDKVDKDDELTEQELFCFSRNWKLPGFGIALFGKDQVTVVVDSGPGVARAGCRAAWRSAFLLSRASANFRSRSAKMTFSRPSSLSCGLI